jgi:hypothetical protein
VFRNATSQIGHIQSLSVVASATTHLKEEIEKGDLKHCWANRYEPFITTGLETHTYCEHYPCHFTTPADYEKITKFFIEIQN